MTASEFRTRNPRDIRAAALPVHLIRLGATFLRQIEIGLPEISQGLSQPIRSHSVVAGVIRFARQPERPVDHQQHGIR